MTYSVLQLSPLVLSLPFITNSYRTMNVRNFVRKHRTSGLCKSEDLVHDCVVSYLGYNVCPL